MRGVPRLREAITEAASGSRDTSKQAGRALDDRRQLVDVVEVELANETESVAQRRRHQARSRGRADQREVRQIESDRPRRGATADHDIEAQILHCRIEDLLDRPRQAVQLVDEEHVAVLEVGKSAARSPGRDSTGPDVTRKPDAHLRRHDARERRLAQPRRTGEEQMVRTLMTGARRAQHDLKMPDQVALAHEVRQRLRS